MSSFRFARLAALCLLPAEGVAHDLALSLPAGTAWVTQPWKALERATSDAEASCPTSRPSNNALQLTRRVGAAAARPVVEARLAGEARCSADLRWAAGA